MKRFHLERVVDASGVSGTGKVAEGVMFTSGRVAMTWLSQYTAVNVYDNMEVVEALHGHQGNTRVVWDDITHDASKPARPAGDCSFCIPYPADWPPHHNACGDPCDMLRGPCACGATHQLGEWEAWIRQESLAEKSLAAAGARP